MTPSQIIRAGAIISALILSLAVSPAAQQSTTVAKAPTHARAVRRLLIRNAMVVYGNAKPAVRPDRHPRPGRPDRQRRRRRMPRPTPDAVIDAHRQVRAAGPRQHARAPAGRARRHSAAAPVRAEPVSRRPASRRSATSASRLRQGEALARAERGARARRAAHPGLHRDRGAAGETPPASLRDGVRLGQGAAAPTA